MFFAANCKSCAWTWGGREGKNGEAERRNDRLVIANLINCTRTTSGKVQRVTATHMQGGEEKRPARGVSIKETFWSLVPRK